MVSREDENGIFLTVIIIIIYRRGTALPWTSVLVSYLFFFGGKKCSVKLRTVPLCVL